MIRGLLCLGLLCAGAPAMAQSKFDPVKCMATSVKPNLKAGLVGTKAVAFAQGKFTTAKDVVTLALTDGTMSYDTIGTGPVQVAGIQIDFAMPIKQLLALMASTLTIDIHIGKEKVAPVDVQDRISPTSNNTLLNVVLPGERLLEMKKFEGVKGDWRFALLDKGKLVREVVVKASDLAAAQAETDKDWTALRASLAAGKCKS